MPQTPTITVQLVHIQGPLKGQVSEFSQFPIQIGRNTDCHVRFGKEMTTISRNHARIECKGIRFRIIDVSTNGTYINGKRIANVYLRDGDVITFSENGPKASFLTKIGAGSTAIPPYRSKSPGKPNDASSPILPESGLTLGADHEIEVLSTNAPLTIQFGQTLQSFAILPVTIGSNPECDFSINDKNLHGNHVQIFFSGENYYAKDLTGKRMVMINDRAIENQAVLAEGAELLLTEEGPLFKFLGDGRLAEIPHMPSESTKSNDSEHYTSDPIKKIVPSMGKKISKLFNLLKKGD